VQPTLQLLDHPNIFAVGDAIDFAEQKQYAKAIDHASVAAANIAAYLQGKPLKSKYNGTTEMILVSIGKVSICWYIRSSHLLTEIYIDRRCSVRRYVWWYRAGRLVRPPYQVQDTFGRDAQRECWSLNWDFG